MFLSLYLYNISKHLICIDNILLERFSNECRKTKTKVIIPANHNKHKLSNEPIRTRSKYMSLAPSTGKRVQASRNWIEFLLLIGRESGARCFNQSQSEVKQNQSKTRITFDTLKPALYIHIFCYLVYTVVLHFNCFLHIFK